MGDLFIGNNLEYKFVEPQLDFSIEDPIYQKHSKTEHAEGTEQLISVAPYIDQNSGAWLNLFAFIEQDSESVDIFYTNTSSSPDSETPTFRSIIRLELNNSQLRCFDLVFVDKSTFIVDCAEIDYLNPMKNYFYIIDETGVLKIHKNDNLRSVVTVIKRQIQLVNNILIRASFEPNGESYLESFTVGKDVITNNLYKFDNEIIGEYLRLQDPNSFYFIFLDFKILYNGEIYILDQNEGVLQVRIKKTFEWEIISQLKPLDQEVLSFDTSIFINDRGYSERYLAILYKKDIIIYKGNQFYGQIELNTYFTGASNLKIAGNIIIVNNKGTTIMFSIQYLTLITKVLLEGQELFLYNPYMADMISISRQYAHRYQLSTGYLRLNPINNSSPLTTYQLQASDKVNICSLQIKLQRLLINDTKIYNLTGQLPTVVSSPSEPFLLEQLVQGPNLKYKQSSQSSVNIQIKQVENSTVTYEGDQKIPNDIIFTDIVFIDDSNYYQIYQLKDLKVLIIKCSFSDDMIKCVQSSQFLAYQQLDYKLFSWWTEDDVIQFAILRNQYQLDIQSIKEDKLQTDYTISFNSSDPSQIITGFILMMTHIFIIQENANVLHCYSQFLPTEIKQVIDQYYINSLGLNLKWKPKQIFGNREINPTLIAIHSDNYLIIADYHKSLVILNIIPLQIGSNVYVAIYTDTLYIIQDANLISEYNIQNHNNIYKMKDLPLYNYTLTKPLVLDYDLDSGFIFIQACCDSQKNQVILVYVPNVIGHSTLLTVLEGWKQNDKDMYLAAGGNQTMYIYLNNGVNQKMYKILDKPQLIISADVQNDNYIQNYILKLTVYNVDDKIELQSNVQVINTYSHIKQILEKLKQQNKIFLKDEQNITYYLTNEFYKGQVSQFQLKCYSCDSQIEIINKVQQINKEGDYYPQKMRFSVKISPSLTAIQQDDSIMFFDQDGFMVNYVQLLIDSKYTCTQLVRDNDLYYSLCSDTEQQVIHITSCSDFECFPLGIKIYSKNLNIRTIAKIGIVGSKLIILDANQNDLLSYPGYLLLNQINIQDGLWNLTDPQIIDSHNFKTNYYVYLSDFSILISKQQVEIILSDAMNGIAILEGFINDQGILNIVNSYHLSLRKYLQTAPLDLVLKADTQFYGVKIQGASNNGLLNVSIIVLTQNTGLYGIQILFEKETLNYTLNYILVQYGSWISKNVQVLGNYVAVEYSYGNKQFIGVYNTTNTQSQFQNSNLKYKKILIQGGISLNNQQDLFILLSNEDQTNLQIQSDKLYTYELHDNIELIINDKAYRQFVEFIAINDFEVSKEQYLLDKYYDDDNSNLWWIILLIVLSVVSLLIIGLICYRRKYYKNSKSYSDYLNEISEEQIN